MIALTPLLDDAPLHALLDLRARGFDLAVVDVSPLPFVPEPRSELDAVAHRLWRLRREAVRGWFERAGVPVAVWDESDETSSFAEALEEVSAFRRHARLAPV